MMIGLLLAGALAGNSPTYLQCTFPKNGAVVDVTADEPNSEVTVSLASTGHTSKMSAAFTPSEVRFQDRLIAYVISRTDLSVQRTIKMISSTDVGSCKVLPPVKRAF